MILPQGIHEQHKCFDFVASRGTILPMTQTDSVLDMRVIVEAMHRKEPSDRMFRAIEATVSSCVQQLVDSSQKLGYWPDELLLWEGITEADELIVRLATVKLAAEWGIAIPVRHEPRCG